MARLLGEVDAYESNTMVIGGLETGGAERLEFWRKSIGVIRSAPIVGHSTGSTKELFANEAAGQTGIRAKIVDNPHNQTLAVAIQDLCLRRARVIETTDGPE
ncbi:O-Antigen ligase [Bradyrhizobium sp. Rc2d]|nr:O-Antigen ligase [Bradyrhizobium sp. Rc2d]